MPKLHPLASKEVIQLENLEDESILILQRYYLKDFDKVRANILTYYPQIKIEDIPFLSVQVFNQCVNENKLMLAIKEWENIHPMLKMIPVEWSHSIPFGIMYSHHPSKNVQLFIQAIQELKKLEPKG